MRLRVRQAAVLAVIALASRAAPARGQGWVVDLSAGSAQYEGATGAVGDRSAIAALRHDGARWLYLSGGAPLDSAGIPWAAAGAGERASTLLHAVEVGVDLGAHAFGYRAQGLDATGWGLTLVGLPFLAFTPGPARLELRSGVLHHTSSFADSTASRMVFDSGVRGWLPLSSRLLVSAEARVVRGEDGSYPFAGAGLEAPFDQGTVWVRAGRWMSGSLDDRVWSAGVSLDLPARTMLRAEYRQEGNDPLYWNGPRRGWTVGLSHSFGPGGPLRRPAPVPMAVRPAGRQVTIRLPVHDAAQAPSVAGDFNGWHAAPMRRAGGFWEARVSLAPGVYHYSFVRPDGSWFVPESTPGRSDDGFGGANAVLVVTGP